MVLTADDALAQLVIFVGVVGGAATWTMWQYLKKQSEFAEIDVQLIFQKKFLMTAAGAVITAMVLIGGSYNAFLEKVLALGPLTYVAAFFSAFGLGFTFNAIGNQLIPSPANPDAEKKLLERKVAKYLTLKGVDLSKISGQEFEDGGPSVGGVL